MSRILLLLVIIIWMCRSAGPALRPPGVGPAVGTFVGGLVLVVLFMGLWSRMLARHVRGDNLHRSVRRFHQSMVIARVMIPVWFAVAIFALGWGEMVDRLLRPLREYPAELPGVILGTLPAFIAWTALWWAQFPADRALREQSLLVQLDQSLPVHSPPGFWSYFAVNLRLQLLFTVVPVALIILVHDAASVALWRWAGIDLRLAASTGAVRETYIELAMQLVSITLVVLMAPEVLRRVLQTQRLPDSPLRRRLEELCRRSGLRYRDILLWRTNNNMGNAAVMGLLPGVRYILLSDLLLETMTDRQIEAVFAHEIGHVKHWHMGWYVVLVSTMILLLAGPGELIRGFVEQLRRPTWLSMELLGALGVAACIGGFFVVFGMLSRWFERQADVYAARMMEAERELVEKAPLERSGAGGAIDVASPLAASGVRSMRVGQYGAHVFASALYRVALVNNIPVGARNFSHGSIADRMEYLQRLGAEPGRTEEFDRFMSILYAGMILALLACGAWVLVAWAS